MTTVALWVIAAALVALVIVEAVTTDLNRKQFDLMRARDLQIAENRLRQEQEASADRAQHAEFVRVITDMGNAYAQRAREAKEHEARCEARYREMMRASGSVLQ